MKRKDDIKLFISIAIILLLSALSVFRSYKQKNQIPTGGALYDVKKIEDQAKSGNISLHEADFQKALSK